MLIRGHKRSDNRRKETGGKKQEERKRRKETGGKKQEERTNNDL